MSTFCVFYSYFESPESIKNIEFFIENGVSLDDDVFYVFLINNHKYSVTIPNQKNVKIICRDNIGHDFGSWSYGLESIQQEFDYYIFMNDTVRGPFLPRYIPSNLKWYQLFCNLISEKVKLSGLTINYFPWKKNVIERHSDQPDIPNNNGISFFSIITWMVNKTISFIWRRNIEEPDYKHVQSMIFCTDKVGIDILKKNIFNLTPEKYKNIYDDSRKKYIIKFEIGMSQEIIKNGFDIAALYLCDIKKDKTGDIWYNDRYFETTINPLETMFIKKNRVTSDIIDFYTDTLKT